MHVCLRMTTSRAHQAEILAKEADELEEERVRLLVEKERVLSKTMVRVRA
jgi:hypothetical protein